MALPIWKDLIVSLGDYDSMNFRLRVGNTNGELIYNGRAYRRPGEEEIGIRINDICADYLKNTLPILSQAEFTDLEFPVTFYVQREVEGVWEDVTNVAFLNDWSYDPSYNVDTMGMAFPINGHIDARQWLMYTASDASSISALLTFKDGSTAQVIIPVAISDDFNTDYNDDFSRSLRSAGSGTAVFDLSAWDDVASVTINGKTWDVVSDCREWVVYYVNAFGGWDSLLIEGNTTERDDLTRHTRDVEYDNRDLRNRGTQNFVNEIAKTYTLVTSWMSDDESSRMHHLLNSPEVYLFNINSGVILPVILANTTTEHKTFKSNGGRMVNYTFDAVLAQERLRR